MTSSSSEIKLDWDRTDRIGLAEAIFCLQKSVEQIQSILEEARKNAVSYTHLTLPTNGCV